jgi:hypothetical protein
MGFKTKIKFDPQQLKRIIKSKQDLLHHNVVTVVRTEAIPNLIDKIMIGYDRLSERMNTLPEDPTNPSNWRQEFKTNLLQELERNLIVSDNGLIIRLGDKEFLGYTSDKQGDPDDTSPLTWMVYYIEGLLGDWAFITTDLYKEKRKNSKVTQLGRFGDGFMISKADFDKEGWGSYISFEEARHPFSGYAPLDIFTEALNEFRLKPFVERAIKASKEGKRL